MMRNKVLVAYFLAIVTSVSYAIWVIFSLVIVNNNHVSFLVSLETIYIAFLLIAWALVIFMHRGSNSFPWKMIRMGLLEGTFYSLGSISLFYALTYAKAFPLTEAVSYSSIILFAIFVRNVNKSIPGFRYFFSTILAVLGIAIIVLGIYGSGYSLNAMYIASLIPIMFFYALAAYYTFLPMESGYDPISFQAVVVTVETAITGVLILLLGLSRELYGLGQQAWIYAAVIAVAIVIGYLSELNAFRIARAAKARVINTINILTNLELVGIALFSIFFLRLKWLAILLGASLLIVGIVFLQHKGELRKKKVMRMHVSSKSLKHEYRQNR